MSVIAISLFFGISLTLVLILVYGVFHQVPSEDRHFLDRPAFGFRLVWPLIQAIVFYTGSWLSDQQLVSIRKRLRAGGVEYSLTPQQFFAAKWVSACCFAALAVLFLQLFAPWAKTAGLLVLIAGFYYPDLWLKELSVKRAAAIHRSLPFYLDVITLAVEAGSNLTGGITQAVQKTSDSPLRKEFSRVLRDIRSGKTRAESLKEMADRTGSAALSRLVNGLIQAEKTGASLAPLLKAQANHLRTQRFQQAEKLAMEAPVKILGPLILFIFPTTALVIGFILISKAVLEGLLTWQPLVWAYHWPG